MVDRLAEVLTTSTTPSNASSCTAANSLLDIRREHLPAVAASARDDELLRFELCCGVSGVHYPDDTGRELHAFIR